MGLFDTATIDEHTRRLILTEEEKSEKLINYWRFALSFYFFFITLVISKEIPPLSIYTLGIGATLYFFFSLYMLLYLNAGKYKPMTKYLNIVVDIALITIIIWMFGTYRTFKNEAFLLYFMWIALGSIRFSFGLTLFTGALCMVCYTGIIIMGLALGTVETGTITEGYTTTKVSMLNQFVKVTYLAFVTIALSFGSRAYMNMARKARDQEMDAERQRMRNQKLESIGFLAGGIAHDFNNILAIISNNLHIAKLQAGDREKSVQKLEAIETATRKATDLTQQLLTFSKGGAPVTRTMPIGNIIEESARLSLTGSNVKLEIAPIPEDIRLVKVDEGQMNQVLNNLLINAIQASNPGGTINITVDNHDVPEGQASAMSPGEYVLIRISDNGHGIPKDHLQKVFDPYFTTKEKGSGLGLATAYSIISRHHGYMTVESTEGKGTTFNILLPASQEPYIKQAESDTRHDDEGVNLKILIMDDEKAFLDSVGEALSLSNHEVAFASDGAEALDLYSKSMQAGQPFDIVLMDLTIPGGMGGTEAIKRLRDMDPNVKAIVASGYSNDPVMADHESYGFTGILPKPFTIRQMETEMKRVTGKAGQI